MNFKKRRLFCLLTFLLSSNFFICRSEEEAIDYSSIDFDKLDEINNNEKLTRDPDPSDNIPLDSLIDIVENINTPLWNHTKQPNGRDVLYLIPNKLISIEYGGAVVNLFFNYTPNMNFSPNEALKLSENQLALENFIRLLNENLSVNESSSLIPLFKKLTIQERKIGGLIQAGFIKGPFTIQLNTSLLFAERNFWLSKGDQKQIKDMFETDKTSFNKKELYRYNFGLGDTRLKFGLNTLNTSSFQIDIGLEGIFPTSKISSNPKIKQYEVDLEDFQGYIADVLKGLRDNLITPQLGNGGHYGLGCYAETKISMIHNKLNLWNRLAFDNLFAANEDRIIASVQTIKTPVNPIDLLDNVYMTKFLKEFVFPPVYKVQVKPGGILNFITLFTIDLSHGWGYGLGYDYYLEQEEQFNKIVSPHVNTNSIRISDAESPSVEQHKLFTEIDFNKKYKKWTLLTALGGDYTLASRNMGKDWTIFLRLGASF